MTIQVIGLGAGGHAKVIVETLGLIGNIEIVGLTDSDARLQGSKVLGVPILGGDEQVPLSILQGTTHFFVGVGSVGNTYLRQHLFVWGQAQGLKPLTVVHPHAIIAPSARLEAGAIVLAGAIVNTGAIIGDNAIINTGAIIEHDCEIGAHAHVATGARVTGGVKVGLGAHIGAGATLRQYLTIGANAIVGAGAVVIHDVPANTTVAGVPARRLAHTTATP